MITDGQFRAMKVRAFCRSLVTDETYDEHLRQALVRRATTLVNDAMTAAHYKMEDITREHQTTNPWLSW